MNRIASSIVRLVVPCALTIAGFASRGLAQTTGAIEGTVTIAGTNAALPDATVSLVGTNRGARTDESGKFRIPGLATGSYQVRAQRIGYTSLTRAATVAAGQTATLTFTL